MLAHEQLELGRPRLDELLMKTGMFDADEC